VRTRRDAKGFSFLEVNDGSCLKNLQVIVDEAVPAFSQLKDVSTGAAVEIEGAWWNPPAPDRSGRSGRPPAAARRADPETFPFRKSATPTSS